MKKSLVNIIATSLAIVMLVVVSLGYTPDAASTVTTDAISMSIPSSVVWSDNFDDEDISDWQLFTVNGSVSPITLHPGSSTAEGGVLRHMGLEWSYAGHNSSIAFGTWVFDLDIQDPYDGYHFYILFSSEVFDDDWIQFASIGTANGVGFYLQDTGEHSVLLFTRTHDGGSVALDNYIDNNLIGWKTLIITRELSGQFYVYMDDDLILKGKNLDMTTSERFYFLSHGGPAIDNITVSDTIDYDAAPPELDPPISNQQILPGASFYYDLNATDYSGIDQWWIDDTQNFTIDDDGVITNIVDLVEGDYNITVSVNDTLGFTQTDLFRLRVGLTTTDGSTTTSEPPTTFPMELAVAAAGVSVIVILVLVIWRTRK